MLTLRLTPAQIKALESATGDGRVIAHARTLHALAAKHLIDPVMGWYEKSIARRVGRYGATTSTWGVIGYALTDSGKSLRAELLRQQTDVRMAHRPPSHFLRSPAGVLHLRREGIEDDGRSVQYARCGWGTDEGWSAVPKSIEPGDRFCQRCPLCDA
ncbi:MAG: hypothetical protein HOW97_02285 [Catenulispora sp.]|nr:hypothetical protein [Catenulispora sp.]